MAIKVAIYQDTRKNGSKLFYVRTQHTSTVTTKEIAKTVQDSCTAKSADVLAIIKEFQSVLNFLMRQGSFVEIEGLGKFCLTMSCTGAISEELFDLNHCLKSVNVHFKPQIRKLQQGVIMSPICSGTRFELLASDIKAREKFAKEADAVQQAGWNKYMGRYVKKQ